MKQVDGPALRFLPLLLAVAAVVLAVSAVPRDGVDVAFGAALAVVGTCVWAIGLRLRAAAAIIAGLALIVSADSGAVEASDFARGFGIAAWPLAPALLALALVERRRAVWVALAGGLLAGPVRTLVYDPFFDPGCSVGCTGNALALVHDLQAAEALRIAGGAVTVVALIFLSMRYSRRLPLLLAAAGAAAIVANRFTELVLLACAVATATLTLDLARTLAARRRVEALVEVLRVPGDLESTLRLSVGDPALTVAYWLEDEQRFVAADGAAAPRALPGQIATEIRQSERLIASVRHDPRVAEVAALAPAIDGPARLAIENERLGARVAFQAAELRASRARIVEHADAERRRIERDVHDGAQQHVLALGFELRAAGAGLPAGDPLKPVIERCTAEAVSALDDLRELSHGIYPAALESGGLAPALRSFSDRSSVPVEVYSVPAGRLPASVERAAFALVADAEARAEGPIEIVIEEGDGIVDVRIDGVGGAPGGVVPDRVAAVGGSLTVSEHRISAVIPCA